jgi:hypothetical protein
MTFAWIVLGAIVVITIIFAVGRRSSSQVDTARKSWRGTCGAIAQPARPAQLQIHYPNESAYLPVDLKEMLCISIGQGTGIAGVMGTLFQQTVMDTLIPGFSALPRPESTSDNAQSASQASDLIIKKGIMEKGFNTIVIPSIDFVPPIPIPGMSRLQFSLGLLTSVPAGKKPQVFLVEAVGAPDPTYLKNIVRVVR